MSGAQRIPSKLTQKREKSLFTKCQIYFVPPQSLVCEQDASNLKESFAIPAWTLRIPLPKLVECLHTYKLTYTVIHHHTHLHHIALQKENNYLHMATLTSPTHTDSC